MAMYDFETKLKIGPHKRGRTSSRTKKTCLIESVDSIKRSLILYKIKLYIFTLEAVVYSHPYTVHPTWWLLVNSSCIWNSLDAFSIQMSIINTTKHFSGIVRSCGLGFISPLYFKAVIITILAMKYCLPKT